MRFSRNRLLITTVLAAIAICASPAGANQHDESASAVRAATQAWIKAYNAGDVDTIVAMYADDAVLMPPNSPVLKGRDAIRAFVVKETAGAKASGITLVLGSTHDAGVAGEMAWDSGNYTVRDKTGATVDSGSYLAVWRKVAGKWKYVRDTWNSDRPLAPASK